MQSIDLNKYDRSDLRCIIKHLKGQIEPVYTHSFEFTKPRNFSFVGKECRPYLRKLLKYLESLGLVEKINLGFNIHQWKITDQGKEIEF